MNLQGLLAADLLEKRIQVLALILEEVLFGLSLLGLNILALLISLFNGFNL